MAQKLGQHFLKNKYYLNLIVKNLNLQTQPTTIIEIGSGHGELTSVLLQFPSPFLKIIAIEKDKKLIAELKAKFNFDNRLEIIEGDVLKILPSLILEKKLKNFSYQIVGNIPYYLTGRLLRILSEIKTPPEKIIFLVQKEVAERIIAKPPLMNLLAAITQYWSKPQIIKYVSRKNFSPPPQVNSAILLLVPQKINQKEAKKYYSFIKALFKQPRKTILNNLKPTTHNQEKITHLLQSMQISLNARPQNLTIHQILFLFKNLT